MTTEFSAYGWRWWIQDDGVDGWEVETYDSPDGSTYVIYPARTMTPSGKIQFDVMQFGGRGPDIWDRETGRYPSPKLAMLAIVRRGLREAREVAKHEAIMDEMYYEQSLRERYAEEGS